MTVPVMAEPIGTTRALQEVSIRARVRGFLKEMHFEEGGDVKKGQLLLVIDEEPFKAKLADAQAALEQAEAALKKAQDSKAREVAAAQLAVGQSMLALAEVEERREQLALQAERRHDRGRPAQAGDAPEGRGAGRGRQGQPRPGEGRLRHGHRRRPGRRRRREGRGHDAEIDLSYCRMFSPIDGRIGLAKVKLGQPRRPRDRGRRRRLHRAGDRPAARPDGRRHPGLVPLPRPGDAADRAGASGRGLPAGARGGGSPPLPRARRPSSTTRSTRRPPPSWSRRRSPTPTKSLLPGEYVKADVKVGEAQDAVVVPEQAVIETEAGPAVYIVDGQGKVAIVPVRATFTYEGLRVLESGLEPGQPVIVEGLQLVRPGLTVKTEPARRTHSACQGRARPPRAEASRRGETEAGRTERRELRPRRIPRPMPIRESPSRGQPWSTSSSAARSSPRSWPC